MTINLPQSADCPFCAYLSGSRAYTLLWIERHVAVFVTREQRGASHLLVASIAHRETLLVLPDDEAGDLLVAVRDAALTIAGGARATGISVWQNNGIAAHQAIPHLHFHVAGTLPEGGTDFGAVPELDLAVTDSIAKALLKFVPARIGRQIPANLRASGVCATLEES
jgi:histidine triad (HIT) family protein